MRLTLDWDGVDRRRWGEMLTRAGQSAIEQSWAYGDAVAAASRYAVRRGVVRSGREAVAIVQQFERRIAGRFGFARIMRGPARLVADAGILPETLRLVGDDWRMARGRPLFWMPELPDGAPSRDLMAAIGKRQMVTGYSSIWIDLARDPAILRRDANQRFRRSLARAEAAGLKIDLGHGGAHLDWLMAQHDAARRARRYVAPSAAVVRAIAAAQGNKRDTLVATALRGSRPVAGMLFFRHGASADYYVGFSDDDGRRACAHHLLLWRAIGHLAGQEVRWLDLGGLNTDTMAGVAAFKLGAGGTLFTLAGTFL